MDTTIPDLNQSPVALWVLTILFILVSISAAIPKILGPLANSWKEWVDTRRRLASEADDADIREKNRQINNLTADLASLNRYIDAIEAWAWQAYYACQLQGIKVEPPPHRNPRRLEIKTEEKSST